MISQLLKTSTPICYEHKDLSDTKQNAENNNPRIENNKIPEVISSQSIIKQFNEIRTKNHAKYMECKTTKHFEKHMI